MAIVLVFFSLDKCKLHLSAITLRKTKQYVGRTKIKLNFCYSVSLYCTLYFWTQVSWVITSY